MGTTSVVASLRCRSLYCKAFGAALFASVIAGASLTGCGEKAEGTAQAGGGKPGAARSGGGKGGGGPKKFMVKTEPVETRPLQYEIETVGTLVEENRYAVPARVAGVASGVNFTEGDVVTTGQELCRIDSERYKLLVDQAESAAQEKEAAVRKSQAALADAARQTSSAVETSRLDVELAESEYRRRAELKPGSVITPEEKKTYETRFRRAHTAYRDAAGAAQTRVALAQAELVEAQSALGSAQAALAIAKDNLADSVVRAPVVGRIQKRSVTDGQYMVPGGEIALLVQTDPVRLRFTVPESKAAALSRSMKVSFTVPALPGETVEAEVYDVGATADPETREVQSWARIPNPDGLLRPGYFASVKIVTESKSASVVVPLGAVLPTELGMVAYVVQDGMAVRKKLETGLQVTGDAIEILSGLEPGEQLVVEGMGSLQDNVAVTVINAAEQTIDTGGPAAAPRRSAPPEAGS